MKFWDFLIEKVLPICAAICLILMIALLVKLIAT